MNNDNLLSFDNVSFSYEKEEQIINQVSFSIDRGEFVSILGPSGSGKSTIFRLITGLERASAGTISAPSDAGFMPQQDLLLDWRTIIENVILPLEIKGYSKQKARLKAAPYFHEFGLVGTEHKYPNELSGGMRQRASFLRATLSSGDLLLLDEPFSALDAMTRLSMQEWLLQQWEHYKKTILFITHDVDEALFLSDRIFLFTEKPLSTFTEIQIPLDRPRTLENMLDVQMVELKSSLIAQLRQQVKL
ncbi:ABC transporter ATP-binding protein [Bacillus alkalicellulosilyticus]|uniref:ABC transporter ATP-binding protein n=1 Tax=Alkalihalobacterium alkalicellulosilyticum TaxID=1912214 RepID=UPI000995FB96|nr:ABC transporter ATP-binding protein [Bacillus alkalicellulosilyticus]